MSKALFAGTFDPPTLGHIDVIRRAAKFCSVIVGIGINTSKIGKYILTVDERIEAIEKEVSSLPNVRVMPFSGLTVAFAKKMKVDMLIRGIRPTDLADETERAIANQSLSGIETVFLLANNLISSTLIRELAYHGADLDSFIPKHLTKTIQHRIQEGK